MRKHQNLFLQGEGLRGSRVGTRITAVASTPDQKGR